MMRGLPIVLLLACFATAAQAQLRTIPADTKRGTMKHVQGMVVEIDGKRAELAAGAQIRDGRNMVVMPTSVPPNILVKYQMRPDGKLQAVWILSPQEAAQPDRRK